MEVVSVVAFYAAVVILAFKVRQFRLALAAVAVAVLLCVALVLQATVSDRLGGYAALVLTGAVVLFGLAARFAAWVAGGEHDGDGVDP